MYVKFCYLQGHLPIAVALEKEQIRKRKGRKCLSFPEAPLKASLKQDGITHLLINIPKVQPRCSHSEPKILYLMSGALILFDSSYPLQTGHT